MRVIAKRTLREFWERHFDAEQPLKAWHQIAQGADWARPSDIKDAFGHASFVGDNRVVFNIAGNKYRLIVHVYYPHRMVLIKFIGSHADYDKINPETV